MGEKGVREYEEGGYLVSPSTVTELKERSTTYLDTMKE